MCGGAESVRLDNNKHHLPTAFKTFQAFSSLPVAASVPVAVSVDVGVANVAMAVVAAIAVSELANGLMDAAADCYLMGVINGCCPHLSVLILRSYCLNLLSAHYWTNAVTVKDSFCP